MSVRDHALPFAVVGVVNTAIDTSLFLLLHGLLGLLIANVVSTSCGMTFSFVANGRFTFKKSLSAARALRFVAVTGTVLWLIQPVIITLAQHVIDAAGHGSADGALLAAKLVGVGACIVINFVAYQIVVWPEAERTSS